MKERPLLSNRPLRRLEICKYWGISDRTFAKLRESGQIPDPDRRIGSIDMWDFSIVENMFKIDKNEKGQSDATA